MRYPAGTQIERRSNVPLMCRVWGAFGPPPLGHTLKYKWCQNQTQVNSIRHPVGAQIECLRLLVFCCFGVCFGRLGLLLLWVFCVLAWRSSSAALGCFGFVCSGLLLLWVLVAFMAT